MVIKKVEIEGFHNTDRKVYDFNHINYLKGPNGTGKSTVLQAIQLALLGYIPGTDKNKTAIFQHAKGRALAVTLYIDDEGNDISISRVWSGTSSNVMNSVEISPEGYDIDSIVGNLEMPIFNFQEFLGMTANKLKDWFIEFLPKSEFELNWKQELEDAAVQAGISEVPEDFLEEVLSNVESFQGLSGIRDANKYFKNLLSFRKSELQRLSDTIKSQVYYDEIQGDAEDVIGYEGVLDELKQEYQEIQKHDIAVNRNKELEKSLSEYKDMADGVDSDTEYIACREKINECNGQLVSLEEKYKKARNELTDAEISYSQLSQSLESGTVCPVLKIECAELKEKRDKLMPKLDQAYKNREDKEKRCKEYESEVEKLKTEIEDLQSLSFNIVDKYRNRDAIKRNIVDVPEIENIRSLSEIESEIKDIESKLIKLKANIEYNKLIDKITLDKYNIETEVNAAKCWEKLTGVNGLQNQSEEDSPFAILIENMNKYLPKLFGKTSSAHFNLEGKANSFSFGLLRDDKYIPYDLLSSGEKCMYALVLMISLIDISNNKLKLVMVDDMFDHLDDPHVDKVFKTLKSIKDIQMIFAGVKELKGEEFVIEV